MGDLINISSPTFAIRIEKGQILASRPVYPPDIT
jgi:hypothetical protein